VGQACIFTGHTIDPAKPRQTFEPLFSFGGYCPDALALCAEHCDVDLMWFEFNTRLSERMKAVNALKAEKGRAFRLLCCTCGSASHRSPRSGSTARWTCAFIFSGYPDNVRAEHFGWLVMPYTNTCSLPHAHGRVPDARPATSLANGERR
jgi:hypothetical protein